jgi:poly(3-hydroxybutyrate) depolymerase
MLRWLPFLAACVHAPTSGGSRCDENDVSIACSNHKLQLGGRTVAYEVPLGDPPASGWPVVVFYQGSFSPGSGSFSASAAAPFGAYQLTGTFKALLDRGYAVIAPDARGGEFWQTNIPPCASSWTGCDDDVFVHQLLAAIGDGTFGPLDTTYLYAMGISSGGFMTSRMAVSYGGTFRALAIASASYATCSATCSVPALPSDHPPTLFLHGDLDTVVPVWTMTPYRDALVADGIEAQAIIAKTGVHEWLSQGKTAIPDWFDAH